MHILVKYLFLFLSGAALGWGLEVIYRRFFGLTKKWMNPGFLSGPYLPLYGCGVSILYFISDLNINIWIKILLFCFSTTFIEFMTGLFFIKVYKTKLWDYSHLKFNFKGIIHPLYSFFWTILSLIFYFALYPYFYNKIGFLYEHLEFSLFIGFIFGIIFLDTLRSFNVLVTIKKTIESLEDKSIFINYENLKLTIKERLSNHKFKKPSYFSPFKGDFKLKEHILNLKTKL